VTWAGSLRRSRGACGQPQMTGCAPISEKKKSEARLVLVKTRLPPLQTPPLLTHELLMPRARDKKSC